MTNTYTAVACYLNDGSSRIFAADATDSTSTYVELTDVITGNSLGDSAQGRTIVKVMSVSSTSKTTWLVLWVQSIQNSSNQCGNRAQFQFN